jgi:ATP-dependent DNA ligase
VAKKSPPPAHIAGFIESMECLPVTKLPEGPAWTYEIKLDGYRLEAVRSAGKTTLYSRRQNILNEKFHQVAAELQGLPDDTVLDGELVALGPDGRPDFNLLQTSVLLSRAPFITSFDILVHKNRDLTRLQLAERRSILRSVVERREHVQLSEVADRSAVAMLQFVKKQGLEGAVAKRSDSIYQPGQRSGLWAKHRINLGQEFVIGGYVPSNLGVDAIPLNKPRAEFAKKSCWIKETLFHGKC